MVLFVPMKIMGAHARLENSFKMSVLYCGDCHISIYHTLRLMDVLNISAPYDKCYCGAVFYCITEPSGAWKIIPVNYGQI